MGTPEKKPFLQADSDRPQRVCADPGPGPGRSPETRARDGETRNGLSAGKRKGHDTGRDRRMDAYLFDLGNVIAGFDHRIFCQRLAGEGSPLGAEEIHRIVFQQGFNDRFEEGTLGGREFYEALEAPLRLSMAPERFQEIWCDIFWENPGMTALLETLHTRSRLVLISNTNPWHLEYTRERYRFLERFDRLILSYEIGARKPGPRIFRAALEAAGCGPERCLYFDDMEENVRAAAALGIPSVLFRHSPGSAADALAG
jgi:glucose-1-phosphatase